MTPHTATTYWPWAAFRITAGLILSFSLLSACTDRGNAPPLDLHVSAIPQEIQAASTEEEANHVLRFGFDLRNGAQEDARQYLPLLQYLQKTTGLRFSLRFSEDSDHLLSDLTQGRLQFAALGAGSYLTVSCETDIVPLVRGVNADGEKGYRSIIVVRPDSPLHDIQELRGKHLAFGTQTSSQGYWIPRIILHQAGLDLQDLGSYFHTESHRDCAEALINRKADACGLQDTLARQLIKAGVLRELAVSPLYPSSGIFAHASVPPEIRDRVRDKLIAFDPLGKDSHGLYHWDRTEMAGGFITSSREDYDALRVAAQQLGLIPETAKTAVSP